MSLYGFEDRFALAVVLALTLAASGCTEGPSAVGPLRFDATMSRATIPAGETATVAIRLENLTAHPVELAFGSSCDILLFISDRQTGDIVHPAGGGWVCATVLRSLELAPGGAVTREVIVRAGASTAHGEAGLPPGEYSAYAMLGQFGAVVRWAGEAQELSESARTTRRRDFTVQ